ncbi:MAG: alpha/beta hydrolase [Bacteroidota bacterium]
MREKLVMIPGTLCDALLFGPQLEGLSDFVDCKVVDNASAEALPQVARNILDEVAGKITVMGLSYGGIIAFEMWRQEPERIENLILLNTTHKLPSVTTRTNQERFVGMAELGNFKKITTDFLKDVMLHPDHAKQPQLRTLVLQMALNTGKDAFIRQVKAQLGRPDSTQDLMNIICPTLLMTGRQDQVCTVAIHEEMERLMPSSTLKIIEHCGHLSTLEQPQEVNAVIRKWWHEHSSYAKKPSQKYP